MPIGCRFLPETGPEDRTVDDEPLPPPGVLEKRLREPGISLEEAWRIFYERLRREASSKTRRCKRSRQ